MAQAFFRVTSIAFGQEEEVEVVEALAGGLCLDFVQAEAPGAKISDGSPAVITLPAEEMLRLYEGAGQVTGSRQDASSPVWDSLNWVYCPLTGE